ncbi:hypothetical protein [Delftia sp. UME58]|uniref:hypothetical protein n=1 Tax=Delftia sp. UME58 TaxID=1862322 RepID=UPI0016022E99|nr:hypothetical protein [Delftia sp. UME58]MBB1651697.1 hypothetical protein [Delftia sp. UME58]
MKSIVVNTLSGAVTEYRRPLHSITAGHGGNREGVFVLQGDTDHDQPIVGELHTPVINHASTLQKNLGAIYGSGENLAGGLAEVHTRGRVWAYPLRWGDRGMVRADPGRGIREVYLGFGLRLPAGQAFTLDRLEVVVNNSKSRRVA